MNLWIVGRSIRDTENGQVWDFQGIFDSKEAAEKACSDETYFVGPCVLNEALSEETEIWPGCYRMMAATQ